MATIGLLFGSFNPVHIGHLALANYMLATQGLDAVWLVVSPQNPFKDEKSLIDSAHRFNMLKTALGHSARYNACDIELHMPLPSYTINTLDRLIEQYPDTEFQIIMGADNLQAIDRWKDADTIFEHHKVLVYPRPGADIINSKYTQNITVTQAPVIDISSTFIRELLKQGRDVQFLVPQGVADYINKNELYR
jgi:nicotinate-nucleotide adenylyltransferase